MQDPRPVPARALRAGLVLALVLAPGCYVQTQRFPGPLEPDVEPLPPGTLDLYEEGVEEVLVVRHSDPVLVRPVGSTAPYELKFHDKQARVRVGSWVQTGMGGKAEVLLTGGGRAVLTGAGSLALGSPSRLEPVLHLRDLTRAELHFRDTEQVRLPGGAVLASAGGPFVLERLDERILRVRNRSGDSDGQIAYRDAQFVLKPGEVVDLGLPASGTAPREVDPGFRTVLTDDAPLEVRGEVEVRPAEAGARLRALGPHEIVGHGQVLRLDEGDEVLIRGIGPAQGQDQ